MSSLPELEERIKKIEERLFGKSPKIVDRNEGMEKEEHKPNKKR